jgi:hypothetical protein
MLVMALALLLVVLLMAHFAGNAAKTQARERVVALIPYIIGTPSTILYSQGDEHILTEKG